MYLVFIMASHLLTFTVAMNTITKHATCSIVFGVVGLVVSFLLAIPRTLERMSWLSFVCMYHVPLGSLNANVTSIHQYHWRRLHNNDRSRYPKPTSLHPGHNRPNPRLRLHSSIEYRLFILYVVIYPLLSTISHIPSSRITRNSKPQYLLHHNLRTPRAARFPKVPLPPPDRRYDHLRRRRSCNLLLRRCRRPVTSPRRGRAAHIPDSVWNCTSHCKSHYPKPYQINCMAV